MDAAGVPTEHPIVGAWRTTISGLPGVPALPMLTTFAPNGILLSALPPALAIPDATSGSTFLSGAHGTWIATGERSAASTQVILQADARGTYLGPLTIRATTHVDADGQALDGTFTADIADPDGTVVDSVQGTFQATRIGVAPMGQAP